MALTAKSPAKGEALHTDTVKAHSRISSYCKFEINNGIGGMYVLAGKHRQTCSSQLLGPQRLWFADSEHFRVTPIAWPSSC